MLLFFIYLLILISLQYFPIRYDVAFLVTKESDIQNLYYKLAFFTHVYTSWAVILLGFFQFSRYLRTHFHNVHQSLGKAYILILLILSAPSGLVMSLFANGGWISRISFIILSIFWIYFTYLAYDSARKKNWKKHREYMIRSYALTLSAVSLRLFKYIIANTLELPPMDIYRIVSWLGWVLNLIMAEIYIYEKNIASIFKSHFK